MLWRGENVDFLLVLKGNPCFQPFAPKTGKFDRKLMPKYRAPARYLSQNKRFRGGVIFDENGCQNGSKNDAKIDLGALGGAIFEIWGGFLRGLIFNEISIGKKSVEKLRKWRLGAAKGKVDARVGG